MEQCYMVFVVFVIQYCLFVCLGVGGVCYWMFVYYCKFVYVLYVLGYISIGLYSFMFR